MSQSTWGVVQFCASGGVEANMARMDRLAGTLKDCDFIVFPELAASWGDLASVARDAAATTAAAETFYRDVARSKKAVVIGTLPVGRGGKFSNAVRVYRPEGGVAADYSKIHLFDVDLGPDKVASCESDFVEAGEKAAWFDHGMRIGLAVCYDLRFPMLFWRLALEGCAAIVVPAAFSKVTGQVHWNSLLRARAIETQSYLIAANQCGKAPGAFETFGHSSIIGPFGEVLFEAGDQEGVWTATLDSAHVANVRRKLPSLANRRPIDSPAEAL